MLNEFLFLRKPQFLNSGFPVPCSLLSLEWLLWIISFFPFFKFDGKFFGPLKTIFINVPYFETQGCEISLGLNWVFYDFADSNENYQYNFN